MVKAIFTVIRSSTFKVLSVCVMLIGLIGIVYSTLDLDTWRTMGYTGLFVFGASALLWNVFTRKRYREGERYERLSRGETAHQDEGD